MSDANINPPSRPSRRYRSQKRSQINNATGDIDATVLHGDGPAPSDGAWRARRPPNGGSGVQQSQPTTRDGTSVPDTSAPKPNRRQNRPPRGPPSDVVGPSSSHSSSTCTNPQPADPPNANTRSKTPNRRTKFNRNLTDSEKADASAGTRPSQKYRSTAPKQDDLTSTLIHALSTPPYPDCLICFAAIYPTQPTWSCSPSIPTLPNTDDDHAAGASNAEINLGERENAQCCWTTFHLKCIRPWALKSVKDLVDAWRARGEDRVGEWRCPGCQSKRIAVPSGYWCFCGSTPDPRPTRLATPHSCGNPCTRARVCGHTCPKSCHPGPCPPCQITTRLPCHCGRQTLSFKCANLAPSRANSHAAADLSCGKKCGKRLSCGNHQCDDVCHPGDCKPCSVMTRATCYCGKEEQELSCGEGMEKECVVEEDGKIRRWTGKFECEQPCGRLFDCGVHRCGKRCHSPAMTAVPCPRSPSFITHCPCGKHALSPSELASFPPNTNFSRKSCQDPIPTCTSLCMKPLEGCSHVCSSRCHTGPCPPCSIMLVRPCRCGATTRDVRCSENQAHDDSEILCDRPCGALRACGRHQCNRVCCPLASLAATTKSKGKKKVGTALENTALFDNAGWHECDLVCGKALACGNHRCEERDHRGVCPPCLQSSFEEMICHCGRTVLEPPIPCGTRINCTYPCSRPPLPCGHPKAQHACHEDSIPCPPCPFLTSKQCACGKKMVDNVRCSQEKVSCGQTCGKLASCGFHQCERLCHGDRCGPCNSSCGKPRKLCLPDTHPCTQPCHAPSACSEAEPCRALVYLTCPCERIRQPVPCGRSTSNPAGREGTTQIKCTNECLVIKRNARLAEALGISPEHQVDGVKTTYNDELTSFAKANMKFCALVEKSFADFLSSDKKSQILPHMPEARRKFVHDLAAIYRMDSQMVDQEPHRSVQLIRRIDSRVPSPLLSSMVPPPGLGLGRLTDLRSPAAQQPFHTGRPPFPSATPPPSRGWTSVVNRSAQASPAPRVWPVPGSGQRPPAAGVPRAQSRASPASPPTAAQALTSAAANVPDNWEDDV